MEDLIKALKIIYKYVDDIVKYPVHCSEDMFYIASPIEFEDYTKRDLQKLFVLGFNYNDEHEGFISIRFDAC